VTTSFHQQAKAIFAEVYELSTDECEKRLSEYAVQSPELVQEVRSLLAYHTGGSEVIGELQVPKIRTRSTLSKTFQSRRGLWLSTLLRTLALSLPVIATGLLVAYWVGDKLQTALRSSVAGRLSEQVDQRLRQLVEWERSQVEKAGMLCQQPVVVDGVVGLTGSSQSNKPVGPGDTRLSADRDELIKRVRKSLVAAAGEEVDFAIWDLRMVTVADSGIGLPPERLDSLVNPAIAQALAPAMRGQSRLYLQQFRRLGLEDAVPGDQPAFLSMVMTVRDSQGEIVGAIMLRLKSLEQGFNELIALWNKPPGRTESYLINERGVLMTRSRYSDSLQQLGSQFTDTILVRDPGVNLLEGRPSTSKPTAWPPTFLALQVTTGNSGLNLEGYRNYVGQPVVGAWRWVPQLNIGLAVEEPWDEAFEFVRTVKRAVWGLTAFFAISTAGITLLVLMRTVPGALRDISDAGPYQVQQLLGQGGMGRVYLAEHALLCRQSAVKVLSGPDLDASAIHRFEREVQLASQLTHPNTIAIYDFGRNKEGLFYYAMEYIHGAHLGELIEYAGPIRPGRCIYILRQLCRALSEAHHAGVVHRDIKPQNVMVCNRGGEPDFVKLFDYGLVKAFAPGVTPTASQTKIVVGTPRFMAPERLTSPWLADPRVDIYSIGALAYYLLTSKLPPLFTITGEANYEHPGIETLDLPTGLLEFGDLLGICLSPDPGSRPSTMKSLLDALEELSEQFPWSRQDSAVWWSKHEVELLQLVKSKQKKLVAKLASD